MAKGKPVLPEGHRGPRKSRVRLLSWHETSAAAKERTALQERIERLEKTLTYTLGQLHVLDATAGSIMRWHADPQFDIEEEAQKIKDIRINLHREIVWAKNHGPDDMICHGHGDNGQKCEPPLSVQEKVWG